jgi:hypothetical protein
VDELLETTAAGDLGGFDRDDEFDVPSFLK